MPMAEVYELFRPKDKATKANRHSLILRPENWVIKPKSTKLASYEGGIVLSLSAENDQMSLDNSKQKISIDTKKETLIEISQWIPKMALRYPDFPTLKKDALLQLAHEYLTKEEVEEFRPIQELLSPFAPSLLKSLLQKIIRTQCEKVVAPDNREFSSRPFLLVCFIILMLHTGSYNLNKQRFVTGLESALKRLAVIICEDSFLEDISPVPLLLACAYIRQQNRTWSPSIAHVKRFFKAALEALDSDTVFVYKTDENNYPRPEHYDNPDFFAQSSFILDKLGAMTGDQHLFQYIAFKEVVTETSTQAKGIKMPLIHCIDQHSFTGLAHFMSYDENMPTDTVAPFRALFSRVWDTVGSMNGRKHFDRIIQMEDDPFVRQVRLAQMCIYTQKFCQEENPIEIEENEEDSAEFKYTIDASWLSGLVGPINVKIGPPKDRTDVIVIIRSDDITDMKTIRNPKNARSSSASDNTVDLTQEEKEEAVECAKRILRLGFEIKHVPQVLSRFKGAIVHLFDNVETAIDTKYMVRFADDNPLVDWNEAVQLKASFPLFDYPGDCANDSFITWVEQALSHKSNTVARHAYDHFDRVLDRYPIVAIKRLYAYLANYRPTVNLFSISRDGSSTKADVSIHDIAVNHMLCAICALFPACLELDKSSFRVKCGPILWTIRDIIKKRIDDSIVDLVIDENEEYWAPIHGDPTKKLFDHQKECVEEMLARNKKGKKGCGINLSVGLGKTSVVVHYMKALIEQRRLPRYVVYTAPSGALGNARSEFERLGVPYQDLTTKPKKHQNYKDEELAPFKINIVAHDAMRRKKIYTQMKEHAGELLFINDEFHLTTAGNTIRSSIALEIARLSALFVCMTGTITRTDDPNELIGWFELLVDFYVHVHNILCAFAALISRKASTGITLNRIDTLCSFTPEEDVSYNAIVPIHLGGTSTELNFRGALKICYEAVNRELVKKAIEFVKKDEIILILAQNKEHQALLQDLISEGSGINKEDIFLIGTNNTITLKPETKTTIRVVITTLSHVTGFTLTKIHTVLSSIYASNEASRTQFEGRCNRYFFPLFYQKFLLIN